MSHPLSRTARLAALKRYFRWQIGSRLVGGTVVHSWVDDTRFFVRPGETGLTQNIYNGLHEFEDMAFLLHFLRAGDLMVDVGANAGSYTILGCGARGASGIALEPIPTTFSRLVENIRLNHMEGRVQCLNIGAGSEAGTLRFITDQGPLNRAVAAGEEPRASTAVDVKPLDTVLAGQAPILMKIDVEGFETPVIAGGEITLSKPTLQAILMELNGSGIRYGFDEGAILKKMAAFGFRSYSYDPFRRALRVLEGKNEDGGNTLFLRDEAFAVDRLKSAAPVRLLGATF